MRLTWQGRCFCFLVCLKLRSLCWPSFSALPSWFEPCFFPDISTRKICQIRLNLNVSWPGQYSTHRPKNVLQNYSLCCNVSFLLILTKVLPPIHGRTLSFFHSQNMENLNPTSTDPLPSSVISKDFEAPISDQLRLFLEHEDFLCDRQCIFCSRRSTSYLLAVI